MPFDPDEYAKNLIAGNDPGTTTFDPDEYASRLLNTSPSSAASLYESRNARLADAASRGFPYTTTPQEPAPTTGFMDAMGGLAGIVKAPISLAGLAFSSIANMMNRGGPDLSSLPPDLQRDAETTLMTQQRQQEAAMPQIVQSNIDAVVGQTPFEQAPAPPAIFDAGETGGAIEARASHSIPFKMLHAALGNPNFQMVSGENDPANKPGLPMKIASEAVGFTLDSAAALPFIGEAKAASNIGETIVNHASDLGKVFGLIKGEHDVLDGKALDEAALGYISSAEVGKAAGLAGGITSTAFEAAGARAGFAGAGALVPEAAVLTIASAAMEGRAPTADDLKDNLAIMLTLHAFGIGKEQMKDAVQMVKDAKLNSAYKDASPAEVATALVTKLEAAHPEAFKQDAANASASAADTPEQLKAMEDARVSILGPEAAKQDAAKAKQDRITAIEQAILDKMTPQQRITKGLNDAIASVGKQKPATGAQELLPETHAAIDEVFKEVPPPTVPMSTRLSTAVNEEVSKLFSEQKQSAHAELDAELQDITLNQQQEARDLANKVGAATKPTVDKLGPPWLGSDIALRLGDKVQMSGEGQKLPEPARVTGFSDDGKRVFVEGGKVDIPVEDVERTEPLAEPTGPRPLPAEDLITKIQDAATKTPESYDLRRFMTEIATNSPNITPAQLSALGKLWVARASAVGLHPDEFTARKIAEVGSDAALKEFTSNQERPLFQNDPSLPDGPKVWVYKLLSSKGRIQGYYGLRGDTVKEANDPQNRPFYLKPEQWKALKAEGKQVSSVEDFQRLTGIDTSLPVQQAPFDELLKQGVNAKAAVRFLEDGKAVLYALQKSDVSSMVHEFAHIFRRDLSPTELAAAEKHFGVRGGEWTTAHEEKFARTYERWIRTGRTSNNDLVPVFTQFSDWLRQVYKNINDGPLAEGLRPTPSTAKFLDSLTKEQFQPAVADFSKGEVSTPQVSQGPFYQLNSDAQKTDKVFDNDVKEAKKSWFRRLGPSFGTDIVDAQFNLNQGLDKIGEKGEAAIQASSLKNGAGSAADLRARNVMANVEKNMQRGDKDMLNRVISSLDLIQRQLIKKQQVPEGKSVPELRNYLSELARTQPARFDRAIEASKQYFEGLRKNTIDLALERGLLSQADYNKIRREMYSPSVYLDQLTNLYGQQRLGLQPINVEEMAGVKKIKGGATGAMQIDYRTLLQQSIQSTMRNVFSNEANATLYDIAKTAPTNALGLRATKPRESGYTELRYYENGVKNSFWAPNAVAAEWGGLPTRVRGPWVRAMSWMLGVPIVKAAAVGYNPVALPSLFIKDVATVLMNSDVGYSNALPIAVSQLTADMFSVALDTFRRGPEWRKAIEQGMGFQTQAMQSQLPIGKQNPAAAVLSLVNHVNSSSEYVLRMAVRKRSIDNQVAEMKARGQIITPEDMLKIEKTATYKARDYLDFSRGGWLSKLADEVIPFFNVGVQAERGVVRKFIKHPVAGPLMAAQLVGAAAGIRYMGHQLGRYYTQSSNGQPPQEKNILDDISPEVQRNNYIMPLGGLGRQTPYGKAFYYLEIPKEETQKGFAAAGEAIVDRAVGRSVDGTAVAKAVILSASPFKNVVPLPPLLNAILGYAMNKDVFSGREVFPGRDQLGAGNGLPEVGLPGRSVERYTQVDVVKGLARQTTNEAFVKFGEATGASPEGTAFVMEQFVPQGSAIDELAGTITRYFQGMPADVQEKTAVDMMASIPGLKRYLKMTTPGRQEKQNILPLQDKQKTAAYMKTHGIIPPTR